MQRSTRMRWFAQVVVLACLASVAAASACAAKKNTELMVSVQTDLRVPKDLSAVTVRIISAGAVQHEDTYVVGPGGLHLPATIGVVPRNPDDLQPIDVEVIARLGGGDLSTAPEKIRRRARVTFAKDRVALVRIPLHFACYDVSGCAPGETCVAGGCAPIPTIEGSTLPTFTPDLVFGEGQAKSCWDPATCLAAAKPLVRRGACDYGADKPFDPENTTVVARSEPLGFCAGGACRVALDRDPDEGWDFGDAGHTVIRLAPGLCARALAAKWSIEATTSCRTKTPSIPYCDERGGDASTGGPCTLASGCAMDPPPDVAACNANRADAKCGALYLALVTCLHDNQVCGADGRTDAAATTARCSLPAADYAGCKSTDSGDEVAVDTAAVDSADGAPVDTAPVDTAPACDAELRDASLPTTCPAATCNLERQTGCTPDRECYELAGTPGCRLAATCGAGEDQPCVSTQCKPGYVCVHFSEGGDGAPPDYRCRHWCCINGAAGPSKSTFCLAGQACSAFAGLGGVIGGCL